MEEATKSEEWRGDPGMKGQMNETNCATGGSNRTPPRLAIPAALRPAAFGVLVFVMGLVLFWVHRDTWQQLKRLREDYALVTGQSFFVGINLRTSVRAMNIAVLESMLHRQGPAWAEFEREVAHSRAFLATNRTQLARLSDLELVSRARVAEQRELLHRTEAAMERYVAEMEEGFHPTRLPVPGADFKQAYGKVLASSRDLADLCSRRISSDNAVLGEFLRGTHETLMAHDRSLRISSALTVGLALLLAVVVYRGAIAPLHVRLNESQALIVRQEKLASLGVLAAGVAHEIRNPLTAIKFRLFSLRRTLPSAYAGDEDLGVISDELTRLERIVRDFLQFARPSDPSMVRLPVARLLEEVKDLMRQELEASGVRLVLEEVQPGWIQADPQQMKQVLINLVRNGAESIPGGQGSVSLRAYRAPAGNGTRDPRGVVIAIRDTGRGIPAEVERRLFDPFFSTKASGTGLGLSIASRIVEKHGGRLRYTTALNRGTTFEIVLPAIDDDDPEIADHRG